MALPAQWLHSIISCLYKKGAEPEAVNYRPLSVIPNFSRIISMIIVSRISDAYNRILERTQYGFRSNSSTSDAIHVLNHFLMKMPGEACILYCDISAAYDKLPRKLLFTSYGSGFRVTS